MSNEKRTVKELITLFMQNNLHGFDPRFVRLIAFRQDGVVLYHNLPVKEQDFGASIAVLMGGAWQAVSTLMTTLDDKKSDGSEDPFRFSFNTASDGVHILSIDFSECEIYLGMIFNKIVNPAKLKQHLKNLCQNLAQYLSHNYSLEKNSSNSSSNSNSNDTLNKYLFNNITDGEMDKLFNLAGRS